MTTPRNRITYTHRRPRFKVERPLTIQRTFALLRSRHAPRRRLIPTRAVPRDLLYPTKGIHGGNMISIVSRDGRDGHLDGVVDLEMKWFDGYGWYPCDYKLTMREAAAVCGTALSTFYRIADDLESRKKIFNKVYFWTQTLFEDDINRVDELARRIEKKKGGRPGAHAVYCDGDPKHRGRCPHAETCFSASSGHAGSCDDPRRHRRRASVSNGWSREARNEHRDLNNKPSARSAPSAPSVNDAVLATPRQTWTEALINELTTDDAERVVLYAEQRADIEAERIAGNFVPKGEEFV